MAKIFLSIGSNIEPEHHVQQCRRVLELHFTQSIWSPVYRSAAVGMEGDDFLNAVVMAQSELSAESVTDLLKQIEYELGRVRTTNKFSSRTMDIDLLLYDDLVVNSAELVLPRAELTTAAHVLVPMVDIEPMGVHPVLNKTYQELLQELESTQPRLRSGLSIVALPQS